MRIFRKFVKSNRKRHTDFPVAKNIYSMTSSQIYKYKLPFNLFI